jgi:predicted transcriptional regulator
VSSAALAEALGKSRATAHRYLTRLALAGHAEVRGKGRGAGFHASSGDSGGRAHLRLVQPGCSDAQ